MTDPLRDALHHILSAHDGVVVNPDRRACIADVISAQEARVSRSGALVTWNPRTSTGRSPKNTFIVASDGTRDTVDWTSSNSHAMPVELFDALWSDALARLATKRRIYTLERSVGARTTEALPVDVITDRALTTLFADTMFRPRMADSSASILGTSRFTVLVLPDDAIDPAHYRPRWPDMADRMAPVIAMDMDRGLGIIIGTSYCGTLKKMVFTVMNYLLPAHGILPLHSAANEGESGDIAVMLGLSGTGKTTLATDPERRLLGDDEHGWSPDGIANFEYGCYAKLIRLRAEKEPDIFRAVFDPRPVLENGVIIENIMMYPDGTMDVDDDRLTENSRAAYPLSFLRGVKPESVGGHPRVILFLTADAHGVLPPVACLTPEQALLWFLMGYTSKLAGTETGVTQPVTTFSRFFGQPFMPRIPTDYTILFDRYVRTHNTAVYLINTGWSGGPYGVGARMDITLTRAIVRAAIAGALRDVPCDVDARFHLRIPRAVPGVDPLMLNPKQTWSDPVAYDVRADALAREFATHFDKAFAAQITDPAIVRECPGK